MEILILFGNIPNLWSWIGFVWVVLQNLFWRITGNRNDYWRGCWRLGDYFKLVFE